MNRTGTWKSTFAALADLPVDFLHVLNRGMDVLGRNLRKAPNRIGMLLAQSCCHLPAIPGQSSFLLLPTLVAPVGRMVLSWTPFRGQRGKRTNISKDTRFYRGPARHATRAPVWGTKNTRTVLTHMEPAFEFVRGESALFSTASAFEPHPLLRNPHLATAVAACWPRNCARLSGADDRYFDVEPGTKLLAKCNWQESRRRHPTLVLIHGLEGSSESPYMLGTGEKAFQAGFNVLRINQRNCGGTEHLTPTLHNSGLSNDYRAVLEELITEDALPEVFIVGYSVGGNLVLKMAGKLGSDTPRELRAVCAVSPCLDLASCSTGSGAPRNFLYERYFLRCIRNSLEKKAKLFPERYCVDGLPAVHTLHGWRDAVVAPAWGYRDAAEYYRSASALRVVGQIRVPTLIVTAQDDPFIPFESFCDPAITGNPFIRLIAPERGGHCAFISRNGGPERFWAEFRVVEFCMQHSAMKR